MSVDVVDSIVQVFYYIQVLFVCFGRLTVQRVTEITLMANLFISSFRSVSFNILYFETVLLNAYRIVNVF